MLTSRIIESETKCVSLLMAPHDGREGGEDGSCIGGSETNVNVVVLLLLLLLFFLMMKACEEEKE